MNYMKVLEKALVSHDGIVAKRAYIVRSYLETGTVEKTVEKTGWSAETISRVIEEWEQKGDTVFCPRPEREKPLLINPLFSTYEGSEWQYYKGALFHSGLELNERALDEVKTWLCARSNGRVLEVGPGEGAMAMMLRDAGYDIQCVDVGDFEFIPSDIPLRILDADKGLANSLKGEQYDLVLALEVIEHLKHPWTLIEDCFTLLKPGGTLLISTPNIASFISRAFFLTDGKFQHFPIPSKDVEYHDHITPLPWYIIEHMFDRTGFKEVKTIAVSKQSLICMQSLRYMLRSVFRVIAYILATLSCRSTSTPLVGKNVIVVGKKKG